MTRKKKSLSIYTPSRFKHIIISILIISGVFFCTIKSHAAQQDNIYLSGTNELIGYKSLIGSYNYSYLSLYSNIKGTIFWTNAELLSTPEKVSIISNYNTLTLWCKSKINGFYYNQIRDQKILWPLDTQSLQFLSGNYTSTYADYNTMQFTGGLFTDCTGANIKSNEIYGQVKHNISGSNIDYYITAGLKYTQGAISIPPEFAGNIFFQSGNIQGQIFDNFGGIGILSDPQGTAVGSQCIMFSGVQNGSIITFSCLGINVSQYIVNIFQNGVLITGGLYAGTYPYVGNRTLPGSGNFVATCTTLVGSNSCNQLAINYNGVNTIQTNTGTVTTGTITTGTITTGTVTTGTVTTGTVTTGTITTGTTVTIVSYTGSRFISGIPQIKNAKLKKFYTSDNFTIEGFSGSQLASISGGYLYINGTGVGISGYVNNGDRLNIELVSSEDYDSTTYSKITVGALTGIFVITTLNPDDELCQLTKSEKSSIESVYISLKSGYVYNEAKRTNIMYTMKSMIKDVLGFDYSCSLLYFQDLVNTDIDSSNEESTHIAPNCKEYPIIYNENNTGYTSSKFKKAQYFNSREALYRFIDSKNPGDCHINSYTSDEGTYDNNDDSIHIAPNGKVYNITENNRIFYSLTIGKNKQFSNRNLLTDYIDRNNPAIAVRDHEVDTNFDPLTYAAPNDREYKIYKTDKGYMSYSLIKIKYFDSLEEIKVYIDANNKK